jgi:hypothetical protein
VALKVVQLHFERFEPPQNCKPNSTSSNCPDVHALQIVGALNTVGNVPSASLHPLVCRKIVANERQDHHDCMLSDADTIRSGHFSNRNAVFDGSFEINVVRTDTSGQRKF